MNSNALPLLIAIPFFGFIISLLLPKRKEIIISTWSLLTVNLHFIFILGLIISWLLSDEKEYFYRGPSLIKSGTYDFFISFYLDYVSATFLFIGGLLTSLIAIYSRYYMHRESGYKRFFCTILLFYFGYNVIILSGNFETLMSGWEILGFSSFLLIAFYRDRFLPVKNALKVFSIYRIGDLGLILVAWLSHNLMENNATFLEISNKTLISEHLLNHSSIGFFLGLMLIISASVKSAQFPFSTWLPRAMEGPTPSSAIFYGSLSVHMGCFILIRTFNLWEQQTSIRILMVVLGLVTIFMSYMTAKVQSSIKSQIAYASIVQIGIIFIEIALGLLPLALFHLVGNAFLRTYQLLVSPSVVSYLIREQFYKNSDTPTDSHYSKLNKAFYVLAVKEWNMDRFHDKFLWHPLKVIGRTFTALKHPLAFLLMVLGSLALAGISYFYIEDNFTVQALSTLIAFIGVIFGLQSFAEKKSTTLAWSLIAMNHVWIALSILVFADWEPSSIIIYLSGILPSWFIGFYILKKINKKETGLNLANFQGHIYEYVPLGFLFLICCMGLSGFPITPSFIGEDLLFHHLPPENLSLAILVAFSYVLDGISIMRIYARVFLGPHVKTYHDVASRSA
jgi:NADH-quinone oxidoreductase subunit L